jgi:O-antigen/teichoic acid export membrane protein
MDIIIPVFDMFCLILLIVGLRWWQKRHGRLSEKAMTLIVCGYGSFFTITTFTSIYFETNHSTLSVLLGFFFIIIVWSLGYLWARWLYRQIYSRR